MTCDNNSGFGSKEIKYEDIITTGFEKNIVDVGVDYAEMGIDAFMTDEVVKEIPVVKTIYSLVKVGLSIKEWNFAKKLITFLDRFHRGGLSEKEKKEFLNNFSQDLKYREKIVSLLLTINDRYYEIKQSEIAGNLFVAFVKGLIEWEDYTILCGCIERYSPFASELLDDLEKEAIPYQREHQNPGDPRAAILLSCAFGYQWGTHFYATQIGIIAHQYGIKADYSRNVEDLFKKAGMVEN